MKEHYGTFRGDSLRADHPQGRGFTLIDGMEAVGPADAVLAFLPAYKPARGGTGGRRCSPPPPWRLALCHRPRGTPAQRV